MSGVLVGGLAHCAALGFFEELSALFLAFQIGDFGFQAVEGMV